MTRYINYRSFSLWEIFITILVAVLSGVTCAEDDHAMTKADVDQLVVELSNLGPLG